eukprot:TRINITY_DN5757_c0_g1_i2.p1 TRINITY_DN5757_c0_g1~~TRINITY_DN5757_c0_g1_i2.p1  ORF type:complete len:129 (-),score=36.14 TRINITY_DN5757_c0_g1_i2:217-603(-)
MKHFGMIKFVNLLAAIIFLVMGILLFMSFTINLSVVEELQQAANFDNWKMFVLLSGIVAILASGVFAFGPGKIPAVQRKTQLRGGRDDLHLGSGDGVGEACMYWTRTFSNFGGNKQIIFYGVNLWIWV